MTGAVPVSLSLVRHARPAAGFGDALDPGLSDEGRAQAVSLAEGWAGPPGVVVTSPLCRAQETAAPLAARWGVEPVVTPAVGELPSPSGMAVDRRLSWLRGLAGGRWADLPEELRAWRAALLDSLAGLPDGAVVFTHYFAINQAVAAATGDERVLCCRPDHCSVTVVRVAPDGAVSLVELGRQAETVAI